ncbi:Sulfate transport system permease protein CysW [Botrimarina colliarenosi]|uniref:Sulfate transport system permease protein CysW n=1 Tax=Botrimarina colliarenosi TaxID=2528001 RepID=A0A5C6ADB8_9BACT|nr:ABC transporter permease subunit [Botrimarina colliarenosi]TWT97954.1 Sulfate transport system permease protein CysW [Botrimarina colliarenosi]
MPVDAPAPPHRSRDRSFLLAMAILGGAYVVLIALMVVADLASTNVASLSAAIRSPEIRYATALSLASATASAALSVVVATPIAYLLSRGQEGRESTRPRARAAAYAAVDALLDVPIVLPPLVVGVSLLVLFRHAPFSWISEHVVYEIPAVVLAQFVVACALAVRTLRATFEQIGVRQEQVALTLGASRATAFWTVMLPQARPGLVAAATVSWARSIGEFGPVLVFASATRMRTEVLPTSVYLELQAGNLEGALAVSVLMIALAAAVLVLTRVLGQSRLAV